MSCEEAFLEKLRERGFRITPQREMILAVLHKVDGFASAEDIYAQVQDLSAAVDISTVYRTLELLEDFQMVAHTDDPDGQHLYELLGIHGLHHHLRCEVCGTVQPLAHADIEPLLATIQSAYGFVVGPESWTFSGICQHCQGAGDSLA